MKPYCIVLFPLFLSALFAFQPLPSAAQELQYPPANDLWNADSLGNHRAVVRVTGTGDIAKVKIVWRRPDEHPEQKAILVTDAVTGRQVKNVYAPVINREYGEIYFQTIKGHATYYVYYMPYRLKGSPNYPHAVYLLPVNTAAANWIAAVKKMGHFAPATLVKLEPVNAFNSFYPMEMIATRAETDQLLSEHQGRDYLVFPEDRAHPVKMKNDLPYRWIKSGVKRVFSGRADKGENYAFQLGIYPVKSPLENVQVKFSSLKNKNGGEIPASLISCINTGGVGYEGKPVSFTVNIPEKTVQALWCYIEVPENIGPGIYEGSAVISADNQPSTAVRLSLEVTRKIAPDHGVNEPWKETRLPWLDSRMAQENTVIQPYTPLKTEGNTISLLGRKVVLAPTGLPEQIESFFPIEMTRLSQTPANLLTEAIHFHFIDGQNKNIRLQGSGVRFSEKTPGTVEWMADNSNDSLEMKVKGHLEFDGFMDFQVQVIARQALRLHNVELHIPVNPRFAKYFMGLGLKGGLRPDSIRWKWDVPSKNQDGGWIGNVNGGMQFSLRDQHYSRPLNTNFYRLKPLVLPASWGNENKGGIDIIPKGAAVLVDAYSGERDLQKGDTLYYNFHLLITPFHTLNTDWPWSHRFYHAYKPVDTARAWGANVINIHHGTFINPYINYPFIAWRQMRSYIDSAHRLGIDVKIYNTIRELSDRAYELYPLRSLGHEVYSAGKGGGYSWLQEHLDSDYIAAWFVPEMKDAAIINSGMNRWHNYYVEGLNWLVKNVGIDGLYLDDVAYDRVTMKRVKRALTVNDRPGIIDLHSANQYDKADGWNNSANLYMELFPYLNKLWFGEYFDYENNDPAFFLTEVSGIPFGLMGEMLQGGGNPWRGMVYGMTSRAPWTGGDPRPVWKLWNDFGMKGTTMIGYWVPDNPVKTGDPNIPATVYLKKGKALVSIASWANSDTAVRLEINWKALGIDQAKATITAPAVRDFQPAAQFRPGEAIPVAKSKGWLLVIQEE